MIASGLDYIIEQYKILHENNLYGISSIYLQVPISKMIRELKPKRVLDYGCGQSSLVNVLEKEFPNIEFEKYDPAIEEYETEPEGKYGLVICTDVLEHIPEEYLSTFLFKISNLSQNVIFNISTKTAIWHLPDGSNCHKTVKEKEWWLEKLQKYFKDVNIFESKYFMLGIKTWSSECEK